MELTIKQLLPTQSFRVLLFCPPFVIPLSSVTGWQELRIPAHLKPVVPSAWNLYLRALLLFFLHSSFPRGYRKVTLLLVCSPLRPNVKSEASVVRLSGYGWSLDVRAEMFLLVKSYRGIKGEMLGAYICTLDLGLQTQMLCAGLIFLTKSVYFLKDKKIKNA